MARPLAHGAALDVQDVKHGWTPLHMAVIAGQTEAVRVLLAAGAWGVTSHVEDKSGMTVPALMEENDLDPEVLLGKTTRR